VDFFTKIGQSIPLNELGELIERCAANRQLAIGHRGLLSTETALISQKV
jgi:hypothetical protein